jgi:hypothetical protein
MITIRFGFHQLDEGVRRNAWDPWAKASGLRVNNLVAGKRGLVYRKRSIEVTYETKRFIRFAVPYGSDQLDELIRLALSFWQRFGGDMDAPPEVRVAVFAAFDSHILAQKVTEELLAQRGPSA